MIFVVSDLFIQLHILQKKKNHIIWQMGSLATLIMWTRRNVASKEMINGSRRLRRDEAWKELMRKTDSFDDDSEIF